MTQKSHIIAVIEDDDEIYSRMETSLKPLNLEILRAGNRREALVLRDHIAASTFWIVDGIFPKYPDSRSLDVLGPEFIRRLQRRYESKKTHIVGLTSDVDVFKGVDVPVFSKEYLEESMGKIALLIQQAYHDIP